MSPRPPTDGVPTKRKHVGPVGTRSAAYVRSKTMVACQVCRARRTKCGEERPCAFCVRTGAICTEDPNGFSVTGDTREILQRLQDLQCHVLDISTALQARESHIQHDPTLSTRSIADTVSTPHRLTLSSINLEELLRWESFVVFEPPLSNLEVEASSGQFSNHNQSLSSAFNGDLDTPTCRSYLDSFFLRVHVKNPVLDQDQAFAWYRSACANGIGWDAESCLVLLIMANGALSTTAFLEKNPDDGLCMDIAQTYFSAAQKRIGALMTASPLLQARCLFLSGVYLMSVLQPFDAWRTFLQALAACQALKSLMCLQRGSSVSTPNTAAEESIYWSCWKSEQELRAELGLTSELPTIDHPLLYPSLPDGCHDDETRAWYFYLAEISLWREEMSARTEMQKHLNESNGTDRSGLARLCFRLADSLRSWQDSLPPSISLGSSANESDILRFVLRGRLSYNYELITWPFIQAGLESVDLGSDIDELISMGLRTHYDRLTNNAPGFEYRHHGTWLMQRSSARSACVLLLAAQHSYLNGLLPDEWALAVAETANMLDRWQPRFNNGGAVAGFMRRMLASSSR